VTSPVRSVRLAELAEEPMVLLDLPHSRDYFQRIFSSAGVTPTVRYRSAVTTPALAVVLLTAANTRPTRRAQAIAQLCRERLRILTE